MIVFLLWALLVVLVLVAAYLMLRRRTDAMAARERELERPETETLRYTLPPGQDPAIVLAALKRGGFAALSPATSSQPHVIIECPQGREQAREPARELLERAATTGFEGEPIDVHHVHFDDEDA